MTVRAWFTISAIVLVALTAAVVYRLLAPVPAPEILVRAGDVKLEGHRQTACWPQRNGEVSCERGGNGALTKKNAIPAEGTIRSVVGFPVQPENGRLRITTRTGRAVVDEDWSRTYRYDLAPGTYALEVTAEYPNNAHVTYLFLLSVTRTGS